MKRKDITTLARSTRNELIARGYRSVTLKDITLHIDCILDAIGEFGQWRDERRAYDPIHATRYYQDNGPAYLAAQDIIFGDPAIAKLHAAAFTNRRALMIEAGAWSAKHEQAYTSNCNVRRYGNAA